MANYSDSTGVLELEKVTPAIKALFGAFNMDESYPGDGKVYIARISEGQDTSWGVVVDNLRAWATELALNVDDESTPKDVLTALAGYFRKGDDLWFAEIGDAIEPALEQDAEIEILFGIAQRIDDGHGLKAIRLEGCWRSSKPRLFEFGGYGLYVGKNVTVGASSTRALTQGGNLDALLETGDTLSAARIVLEDIQRILDGIPNDLHRDAIRQKLAVELACQQ
ncbi:MAG: hypothetical protein K8L99_04205 [Anaerolineae bacterium]|nr:hypothetical protein [Anaerolineae bacterium]MCZ2113645.1 hypothetical protein [Anaerolineae bacterium]